MVAGGLAVGAVLFWLLCCFPMVWVRSSSIPPGFYLRTNKAWEKGDVVMVSVEATPWAEIGKQRGYFEGSRWLTKYVAAVGGDQVDQNPAGELRIDGVIVPVWTW